MRRFYWLSCALLTACGPELATESTDTGATSTGAGSTGEATTHPTTSTDGTSSSTGDATGDATTDATTDATGDATTDATNEAACIDTFKHEEIPEQPMTCGLPELCGGGEPLLFDILEPDGWTTDDIERARCMAAAMRDRTPGIFSFRHYGGNAWETTRTIELLGDQAIVTLTESSDFNIAYTERLALVQSPAFFAACADGSATVVHNCLTEGVDDMCIETLECPN